MNAQSRTYLEWCFKFNFWVFGFCLHLPGIGHFFSCFPYFYLVSYICILVTFSCRKSIKNRFTIAKFCFLPGVKAPLVPLTGRCPWTPPGTMRPLDPGKFQLFFFFNLLFPSLHNLLITVCLLVNIINSSQFVYLST
jgi:hypothetical protein